MGRYVLKRFVYMALTLFLITTLTFFNEITSGFSA